VIANHATIDVPLGPAEHAAVTISPTGDFDGLLTGVPSTHVADSVLHRLAADPCLLCRLPDVGGAILGGIGHGISVAAQFFTDNPVGRAVIGAAYIFAQFAIGFACGTIPGGAGAACGVIAAVGALIGGQALFGDPSDIPGLLLATVIEPIRALIDSVRHFDAAAIASAAVTFGSMVAARGVLRGSGLGSRVAARACSLQRVGCISASAHPSAAAHALTQQAKGRGIFGRLNREGTGQRRSDALRGIPTLPGFDRDEYPPAFLRSARTSASVLHISPFDNRGAGSSLAHQLARLDNGQLIRLLVVP